MLLEFRVDVALVEGPVSDPRVVVEPWREDELIVIAPPTHSLTNRSGVTAAMIASEPFLVREPGSGTRAVTEQALAAHGVRLTNTMRVGGPEAIKQAVAAGLGLAIVSRAAAADQIALGRIGVLPMEGFTIRRTLAQIKLQGRASTTTARQLEALLTQPLQES
jgi:DNA-binding transcriptional LysR family regulator